MHGSIHMLAVRRGRRAYSAERLWWWSAGLFLLLFLLLLSVQVQAPQVELAKPIKFALATAIHLATISWAAAYLRPEWRSSPGLALLAFLSVGAAALEVGYITLQAGRGLESHFNVATTEAAFMWSVMAGAAVVVLAPLGIVGTLIAIDGRGRAMAVLRLAIAAGFLLGTLLTLVTAFRMGANMSHFVGSPPALERTIPLLGWSLTGSDLRPAHFLATHIAQAVPLFAILAGMVMPARWSKILVLLFAAGWAAATILIFVNALARGSLLWLWAGH